MIAATTTQHQRACEKSFDRAKCKSRQWQVRQQQREILAVLSQTRFNYSTPMPNLNVFLKKKKKSVRTEVDVQHMKKMEIFCYKSQGDVIRRMQASPSSSAGQNTYRDVCLPDFDSRSNYPLFSDSILSEERQIEKRNARTLDLILSTVKPHFFHGTTWKRLASALPQRVPPLALMTEFEDDSSSLRPQSYESTQMTTTLPEIGKRHVGKTRVSSKELPIFCSQHKLSL